MDASSASPSSARGFQLADFLRDWSSRYFSSNGVFWRTLKVLVLRPGMLAVEHREDRRLGYVPPLRLCVMLALLFCLALQIGAWIAPQSLESRGLSQQQTLNCSGSSTACERDPVRYASSVERQKTGANTTSPTRVLGTFALTMLALSPLFAALLALAYSSRRMPFGDHFVFSLHTHAVWFVGLLLAAVLGRWLAPVIMVAGVGLLIVHNFVSLQRVYEDSVVGTVFRGILLFALYGLALGTVATLVARMTSA
ncbi:MAG TPA: DUF3667 domain-containing protein [Burkholderiaceae bacterium]|nr:DUF3667 domain-containing protein [Burkholderiaceae bacterium]